MIQTKASDATALASERRYSYSGVLSEAVTVVLKCVGRNNLLPTALRRVTDGFTRGGGTKQRPDLVLSRSYTSLLVGIKGQLTSSAPPFLLSYTSPVSIVRDPCS